MYPNTSQSGLASLGRNGDTMLVHMSPGEVAGLQQLAVATGGSLTMNPYTGYPEASWLSNLIPSIAAATLNKFFPNLGSVATSAIVAGATGLIEGSFEKGLRSGMQAYGTSKSLEGLKASATADRAAKTAKLEELKRTVNPAAVPKTATGPDIFGLPTVAAQTVRTPDIQAQIDQLTKELAVPQKTGLGGLWQGFKAIGTPAGGQAFMRTLEGNQTNPMLQQLSRNAALSGLIGIVTPEEKQPKSAKPTYYIPGAKNPLYGTGKDQPYYLPGTYSTTFPTYAEGGMVPADEGIIPARNQFYPMANIKSAGYSTATQRPRSAEILGGYDAAVDPFTGEEVKSQSNFADGGQVNDYLSGLRQQVNTPAPFAITPPPAGPEGLHIYQAPYKEGWVPPAGIKDYYTALLSPPAGGRDTSALTDYLRNLNKQVTTPTGPTGPTSPTTCPPGQHLNAQTMECVDDTVTPPVQPPVQSCPSGTYKDPSGNCLPIQPPSTECPAGKAFNPVTGKCDTTAKGCDPGTHLEIVDGIMNCVPDEPEPPKPPPPPGDECKPGYVRDENGNCVRKTAADTTCPDGSQQYDEEGRLICPEAPPPPPPPPPPTTECKPGYVRDNDGNCVRKTAADTTCPDGSQQYDEEGRLICPEAPPERPPTCPEGTMFDPVRVECVSITPPTPSEECKPGYERTESGKCKKIYTNVEDDPVWVEVIRRLGGVLYPWQTDAADALYKELKKADIITTEKRCRGGADKIFDADSKTLLCPEDMPTGNESEKQDPRDLRGSTGYGYDFGCPDPAMMIRLAGGSEVAAGDLKVGDMVHTMHEKTLEWGDYEVTHKEIVTQPKLEILFDGGKKKVIVSESHRFWTNNNDWVYAIDLDKGDVVSGHAVSDISILGEGPVVKITVNDAHTYIMENLFSHNIKSVGPSGGGGRGYDVDVDQLVDENGNPIVAASGGMISHGGLRSLARGGMTQYAAAGKLLRGAGDGMSDDIPANINGNQQARLADGEFVIPADVVSHIGNGSTNAGAKKLYKMMADIRRARTGRTKQAPAVRPEKYMPRASR